MSLKTIKVFLSSPGDVAAERDIAENTVRNLSRDVMLRDKLTTQVVAWDRAGGAPMPANLPPQEAINRGLTLPSQCDIVIVMLWSRIGTPLGAENLKPNGERYASGTDWEFCDAKNAPPLPGKPYRPFVLVYRCVRDVPINPLDEHLSRKFEQLEGLQEFFKQFENDDGSLNGLFKHYKTVEEFRPLLEGDLRGLIRQILH